MALPPQSPLRPLRNTTTHVVVPLPQTREQLDALRGIVPIFLEALGVTRPRLPRPVSY
ncbi:hypothetical protein F4782DRAFT_520413 [Xylaria castorea]|nr:hypothetical protein F4782DRAFT_520413 [Xylaria castorea]